jgi:hypothetical protein
VFYSEKIFDNLVNYLHLVGAVVVLIAQKKNNHGVVFLFGTASSNLQDVEG